MLTRRDLMPPMRSFSETELAANPTNKLRLICLAQCEPLCSIDWYLNGQPFFGSADTLAKDGTIAEQLFKVAANDRFVPLASGEYGPQASGSSSSGLNYSEPLLIRREFAFKMDKFAKSENNFILLEDVFQSHNNSLKSPFTWFKETSLASAHQQLTIENSHLGGRPLLLSRKAMPEAANLRSNSFDANVLSKLEITYNQLSHLLSGSNENDQDLGEILIQCRLNRMLDGSLSIAPKSRIVNAINDQPLAARKEPTFWHALIDSDSWFPNVDELRGDIPGMSSEPVDLGLLYAFGKTSNAGSSRNSTSKQLYKQTFLGEEPDSGSGMQIKILLDSK